MTDPRQRYYCDGAAADDLMIGLVCGCVVMVRQLDRRIIAGETEPFPVDGFHHCPSNNIDFWPFGYVTLTEKGAAVLDAVTATVYHDTPFIEHRHGTRWQ